MNKNDGLQDFIEKIEDLAVLKAVLIEAMLSLRKGGRPPLVPSLNDTAMMDVLTEIFEHAFKKAPDNSAKESKIPFRGPQDWSKVEEGYQFYSGAEGEPCVDLVSYNDLLYICKESHRKIKDNSPTGSAYRYLPSKYWELYIYNKIGYPAKDEHVRSEAPIVETDKNVSDPDFIPLVK